MRASRLLYGWACLWSGYSPGARRAGSAGLDAMTERILILDVGPQYAQLIARRVRENGVYCESLPCTADDAAIRAFAPSAVILSGGPASTTEAAAPLAPEA